MNAPTPYAARVSELEAEGLTTSDAQGVAEVEFAQRAALRMLAALQRIEAECSGRAAYAGGVRLTPEAMLTAIRRYAAAALARAEGRV